MHTDFLDALVRYEAALRNHLDDRLAAAGTVRLGTLSALQVLARHPGAARVQELRTELGITVGAASKLVDRLERDGLAARAAHPDDRRSSLVTLTAAGEAALHHGTATLERALDEHLHDEPAAGAVTTILEHLLTTLAPAVHP